MAPCSLKQRTVFTSVMYECHEIQEEETFSYTRKHSTFTFVSLLTPEGPIVVSKRGLESAVHVRPTQESTTLKNLSFHYN